jgi:hypothetical protein
MSTRKLQIRNSTAEFLIFTRQAGEDGIEVRVQDEMVWLTQKLMAVLFDVIVPTINEHLSNLQRQGEITASATIRKFRTVQTEGGRQVNREVEFYNLDAINERDILDHPGKVAAEVAKAFAESEFEKYRLVQDRLFESDFDQFVKEVDAPHAEARGTLSGAAVAPPRSPRLRVKPNRKGGTP